MATHLSDQITKIEDLEALRTDELGGRRRIAFFEFTVPTGNAAADDTVELTDLPAAARFLGGKIAFEAMSSGGGDASIQLGDGSDADRFLGTTSVDAAGQAAFGNTIALGYGARLAAKTRLTATVVTEAWAAGKKLRGEVEYVTD